MLMPFLALVAVFAYLPLWGWRYAFFDYKVGDSISMENFVGFKWFTELFKNPATVRDIDACIEKYACHERTLESQQAGFPWPLPYSCRK